MVTNRGDRLTVVVQALVVLATAPRGMATSAEIADQIDAHPVVLRTLLGRLRLDGLVESRSGPKGGWAIARDPSLITLGRIHRALAPSADSAPSGRLGKALTRARDAYVNELDQTTLAMLLDG
jgi:Rrf2 family protein